MDTPTQIYGVTFQSTTVPSINELLSEANLTVKHIEGIQFDEDNEVEKELTAFLPTIKKHTITLQNGAEANFAYSDSEVFKGKKRPMVLIIHGGPFGYGPQDIFLQLRTFYLLQGYALLNMNYRGSTSYGEDFLNSLLGNIGDRDVEDCGELTKLALSQFSEIVDPSRVAVYGGSHGGFLTGWLIGHPAYKDLWKCSILWNPVINMSYMYTSTDIPDWILSCCLGKDWTHQVSSADNKVFWDKSPISVVGNVQTPALILIGGSDKRVPPHQGYQYHHILKEQGVKSRLYNYPEDGHAIGGAEPGMDAVVNMFMWLDEHFNQEEEAQKMSTGLTIWCSSINHSPY